jgi:DNA repair protein RecN (Recombination protein N)
VFHIESRNLREEIANATDLPLADEPEMIIGRRLYESGRTSASLNGHPITGAMLKQVGEILVDVHGQHDAQYLLKPANQLAVIDEYGSAGAVTKTRRGTKGEEGEGGGCLELRERFSEIFGKRQGLRAQQKELTASRTLRRQQLELYEFQAKEIDDAQLVAGEHQELEGRSRLLTNLEKVKRTAGAAYGVLYDEERSVIERLKGVMMVLQELTDLDESLGTIAGQVKEATVSLDDAAFSLRRYVDRLELDPGELAQVTERLNLVNRMVDKYAGRGAGGLEEVLGYREQIGKQIAELKGQDQDFSTIGNQIAGLEKELLEVGRELTLARKKAAEKLMPLVHRQLMDLGMKEARFLIEFEALNVGVSETDSPREEKRNLKNTSGVKTGRELKLGVEDYAAAAGAGDGGAASASGLETVEFMIAPNPGQPARPLRRIASGGELSRVMLALKGILAQSDRVSVLVFDEIDANVGGRMGTVIGEKLRALSGVHQVLCITHLPQIAAFADRHLTIRKKTQSGETVTTVTLMEGDGRVQELAEMTSGKEVTAASLAQARELLATGQATAAAAKKAVKSRK